MDSSANVSTHTIGSYEGSEFLMTRNAICKTTLGFRTFSSAQRRLFPSPRQTVSKICWCQPLILQTHTAPQFLWNSRSEKAFCCRFSQIYTRNFFKLRKSITSEFNENFCISTICEFKRQLSRLVTQLMLWSEKQLE